MLLILRRNQPHIVTDSHYDVIENHQFIQIFFGKSALLATLKERNRKFHDLET
jgi:hypothetical protein